MYDFNGYQDAANDMRSLYRGRISSVGRALDHWAEGRGFDFRGRINTQYLKNNWEMKVLPLPCNPLDLRVAQMTS